MYVHNYIYIFCMCKKTHIHAHASIHTQHTHIVCMPKNKQYIIYVHDIFVFDTVDYT